MKFNMGRVENYMKFNMGRIENFVGKGENAGFHHFLLSHNVFKRPKH